MFGKTAILSLVVVGLSVGMAHAVAIETVPVGNAGNAGELSGEGAGGYGPDVVVGAVDYEYNIGKYEVTNAQYAEFLNAVAASDPYDLYNTEMWSSNRGCKIERSGSWGTFAYSVAADRADRPVNFVSWCDAARFSNWLTTGDTETGVYTFGGIDTVTNILDHETAAATLGEMAWFIPTEDEWYKAAYHKNDGGTGNYWDYPTSTNSTPSNDLIDPDPGNNANFYVSGSDRTIGSPYYMTEVGEFENSQSPYGTLDQGGNLSEWNETLVSGSSRVLRGGGWDYYSVTLHASYRLDRNPALEYYYVGFRVANISDPVIPMSGDLNDDGLVSSRDLDIVRAWWGADVEPGNTDRGDASGDGKVGSADLDIVRANWGNTAAAAVPEPSTALLLVVGAVLLTKARWRNVPLVLAFVLTVPVGLGAVAGAASGYEIVAWGHHEWSEISDTPAGNDFVQVSGGVGHSLALRQDGSIAAWGWNEDIFGNITGQVSDTPIGNDFVQVSAGALHGLALRADGGVEAWGADAGERQDFGQVSDTPTGNDFVQVSAGSFHSLALRCGGSIAAWGADSCGQVSDAPAGNNFVQVSGGYLHSLALRSDGSIVAWGAVNGDDMPAGNDFVQVSAGSGPSLALRSDGSIVAWGADYGDDMPAGNDFVQVSGGFGPNLALRSDGSIVAWGGDNGGRISDMPTATGFTQVAAGGPHSLALRPTGILGDLSVNGTVGSDDLDIVRANWGKVVAGCALGDPSGDRTVGSADVDIVRANWGNTAAAAVPEPGVLVLSIGGAVLLAWRRSHRRFP